LQLTCHDGRLGCYRNLICALFTHRRNYGLLVIWYTRHHYRHQTAALLGFRRYRNLQRWCITSQEGRMFSALLCPPMLLKLSYVIRYTVSLSVLASCQWRYSIQALLSHNAHKSKQLCSYIHVEAFMETKFDN
jgi:hypothetical protein